MTPLIAALIAAYKADTEGVTEVQQVTINGTITGGSFTVSTSSPLYAPGGPSDHIAYNVNLAFLSLGYVSVFGGGAVVIAGTVANHTITYVGAPNQRMPKISVDISGLTGATGVTVTRVTPGRGALMTLTTGIYQGTARKATFDYVTISGMPGGSQPVYDRTDGDHPITDGEVTFSVWCNNGGHAADDIANSIILKFLNFVPPLDQGNVTNVILARPPIAIPQVATDDEGNSVTQIPVSLKYFMEW